MRAELNRWLESTKMSQEAAASAMGISGAALSAWRKGKYAGDNAKVEALVSEFLSRQSAMVKETNAFKRDFDFVETSVYEAIRKGVELTEARGEIRPVLGRSGIGKTTALAHIREQKQSAIFVEVYKGIRKNRFLAKICKAAGLNSKGTFDDLFETIVEQLNGTGRLIIIDEAEHLPIDALDAVRRINDFTGCGIVLVGLPIFYKMLCRYPYIYNRTAMPVRLDILTDRDAETMVETMLKSDIPSQVWHKACGGIGRDLKMIVIESLRVARLNGVNTSDVSSMIDVINAVGKELGRQQTEM